MKGIIMAKSVVKKVKYVDLTVAFFLDLISSILEYEDLLLLIHVIL
jgi:hypothetical protein